MKLYAWVGQDERGSGVVGLKQALVPAGYIPLVCIEPDRHKLESPVVVEQLQAQATRYGVTIYFVEFSEGSTLRTLAPHGAVAKSG